MSNASEQMGGRIAVFGGTFNPPHAGHLACVRIALAEFGDRIERILVMPQNEPYYKEAESASPDDRLAMCRLAFADVPQVEVSDMDIVRGGVTYTVDTLADVAQRYPREERPVFILGADSFASLSWWKESDRIARGATFLVISRGEAAEVDVQDRDVWVAEAVAPALSSTEIRERLKRGETVGADVPEPVLCYIRERNLYRADTHMAEPIDVYSEEFLAARKCELFERVGQKRYDHSIGVAETAVELARIYGVDERKAYLAGLLHDWDKAYDDDGIRRRAEEVGLAVPDEVLYEAPQTLHGLTAAAWFADAYPDIPADVLQAISRHTTGAPDMSDLDMVLFIADALEPNRRFAGIDELRAEVGKETLEDLFVSVESFWITLIVGRKRTLHPDTFAVWNTYAARYRNRHPHERGRGNWDAKPFEALE